MQSGILPKLQSDFPLRAPVKRVPELIYNAVLNPGDLTKQIYANIPKQAISGQKTNSMLQTQIRKSDTQQIKK